MRLLVVIVVSGMLAAPAAGGRRAPSLTTKTFRTPSKNIACAYYPASSTGRAVFRCDLLSGLQPRPTRHCDVHWTGASMGPRGKAGPTCAGDTVYDRRAPTLAYGSTWSYGGITCTSRSTGLTCRNRDGHGFFLSRRSWRVF
ncbi:MAG TPA: DUF6636 domain-containing protein [Gaiellaceae bacterium]|nr:DUF6636 domain-containing protein [Gaiellaceae bacterium]